ncbi:HNH endonuclease [Micromonospora profundi]|uniref:HNH endonuclease n=1 Tax=Micromonospora profundi TaxID=1420889 RepID=UPI0035E43AF7
MHRRPREDGLKRASDRGYPCLGCGTNLYPTGLRGGVRKRCEPCTIEERRRQKREAARRCSAKARAKRLREPREPVRCKHCGERCPDDRLTCDPCRTARKKRKDAERHMRTYPAIQAARPPESLSCVDCGAECRRSGVKGPKPKRCADCLMVWKRELRRQQPCNGPGPTRIRNDFRRARVWGVDAERFERSEIFERDGWICQICWEPVDRQVTWPHPKSASLDHIIPISKGGPHTRANVRLADLRCNLKRNNRLSDRELELLGLTTHEIGRLDVGRRRKRRS